MTRCLFGTVALSSIIIASASCARADCEFSSVADQLIDYTFIGEKTIDGTFNGCNYGQAVVFTDNTMAHCSGYVYLYAYQPTVFLFANGSSFYMCINDELIGLVR
jgi:hypothetical protein